MMLPGHEISEAEFTLIRQAQAQSYSDEIATLSHNGIISKSTSIYKLSPFLDSMG